MDEFVSLLESILDKLTEINDNLNDIKGSGPFSSITDVYDKLDEVQSGISDISCYGVYSLSDICNKLDTLG